MECDIIDLLPHRGLMRLVQEVVSADEKQAVTRSTVNPEWPLVAAGQVDALVLVELVAQTCGICNGLERQRTDGDGADKKGWLVGIKQARFHCSTISVGDIVEARAENSFEFEGFREIRGEAYCRGKVIAEVILQVVRADAM